MTILEIERHLNNYPLTYLKSDAVEKQKLTSNVLTWGHNALAIIGADDGDEVTGLNKRLHEVKRRVWR